MINAPAERTSAINFDKVSSINSVAPVIGNDWHVVASATSLAPATLQALRLLGKDLVLWRSASNAVQVWEDRCPHRSVRLSNGRVVENTLVCPYHGMAYGTNGRCLHVPAHPDYVPPKQACVQTFPVQIRYGLVFVCLGANPGTIPSFPEWEDATFVKGLSGPHYSQTGGYRAIENFLDVAHFPFVHTDILGDQANTAIADYAVKVDAEGVHIPHIRVWQPDPIGTGSGAYVDYVYAIKRPLTGYLRKTNPTGEVLSLLYCVTPLTEEECIGWMIVAMNFIDESGLPEAIAFQDTVVQQDVVNLETHMPKQLPLDMKAEFHVPCDRASLAYRRWLKRSGVIYGVI